MNSLRDPNKGQVERDDSLMAKFMHRWGELNFLLFVLGFGALIPSFDGTFIEPMWLTFSIIGTAAASYAVRAALSAFLESRSNKVRIVSVFD